jgi:glycosyltransferase involved in cell wall biosynthesis
LKLDIVHTQQPFGMGMHGWATAKRLDVPLVSTFHTLYTEYTHYFRLAPRALSVRVLNHLMHKHYAACASVVVPSREAGRRLERIGIPADCLRVIPTGVSSAPVILPSAIEQARKDLQLPERVPILLFVGRVAREKNLDLLIDAYDRFCQQWALTGTVERRPMLLIVGSGPYLEGCRRRVRHLGLEATVRFAGYISRDRLAPVYRLATLFCFPSLTETQGVVLSEAQSHGLPCIVADGGGAPEFVRPGVDALLVPNKPEEFAAAIQTLLNQDDRRRAYSAAARESPLRPSPTQMAERIMTLYGEVLGAVGKNHAALPFVPKT